MTARAFTAALRVRARARISTYTLLLTSRPRASPCSSPPASDSSVARLSSREADRPRPEGRVPRRRCRVHSATTASEAGVGRPSRLPPRSPAARAPDAHRPLRETRRPARAEEGAREHHLLTQGVPGGHGRAAAGAEPRRTRAGPNRAERAEWAASLRWPSGR